MAANLAFAGVVIVSLVVVDLLGHLPLSVGVAGHGFEHDQDDERLAATPYNSLHTRRDADLG